MVGNGGPFVTGSLEKIMPLSVGIPILLGTLLFIYDLIFATKPSHAHPQNAHGKRISTLLLLLGMLCMYITTRFFPWNYIQRLPYLGGMVQMLQFPWRFLSYATVFLAACGAYAMRSFSKSLGGMKGTVLGLAMLVLIFTGNCLSEYTFSEVAMEKGDIVTYEQKEGGEYLLPSMTDVDVDYIQYRFEHNIAATASNESIVIDNYHKDGINTALDYRANGSTVGEYIEVPLIAYSGYQATLNDEELLQVGEGTGGLLRIYLSDDTNGHVRVHYKGYILWDICLYCSLLTLLLTILRHTKWTKKALGKR